MTDPREAFFAALDELSSDSSWLRNVTPEEIDAIWAEARRQNAHLRPIIEAAIREVAAEKDAEMAAMGCCHE